MRPSVETTQKQRESSTANESAVVTLFPEKLQNMGTLLTSTGYQLLTLERNNQRRLKSDAEAEKARDERVKERRKHELERQEIEAAKKRKELNQSGLPILDIASTASSFSLYTNLNEPSCSTSCDGDEETDEIIQVDKLTSTDDFEILWEEQKTLKQRQKNSIICLQALYIESETNIILTVLRKLIFTLVYHPMKSL